MPPELTLLAALDPVLNILKTILGIGGLIVVHELGHFLVGRWAGVRAEAFSIGFGPVLAKWKPGPTEYRLSAVPLGGYVKFLGENPGEEGGQEPDSFPAATYPRKAAIMLAGVAMNVVVGVMLFVAAFSVGVTQVAPIAGSIDPGLPAWEHGLREGDRVLSVNGETIHDFEGFKRAVMLEERVTLLVERDGKVLPPLEMDTSPMEGGLRRIGVDAPMITDGTFAVEPRSTAFEQGFRDGDRVRAVDGTEVQSLAEAVAAHRKAAADTVWTVERDGERLDLTLPWTEAGRSFLVGVLSDAPQVDSVQRGGAAWEAGLRPGDVPVTLGAVATSTVQSLNLAISAAAAAAGADTGLGGPVVVERDGERVEIPFPDDPAGRLAFAASFASSPVAADTLVTPIPEGVGESAVRGAGMGPGSRILSVDGNPVTTFQDIRDAVEEAGESGTTISLRWAEADGTEREASGLVPTARPIPDMGGILALQRTFVRKESGVVGCVRAGLLHTHREVMRIFSVLGSIVSSSVSPRSLAGPVAIASIAYDKAGRDWGAFLLFLGMISMNLAVLNVLPIPLLDGGQLAVLTAERIRGEPLPESIVAGFQWAGLVFLLGLMVFVIANDIIRMG